MAKLELQNIKKSYDHKHYVLKGISLTVNDGELVSILGPSGCGKSTTLNIIAGFLHPTSGQVFVNNKDISKVPVQKRNFGMVFQDYALFPKMTVFENVAFGLKQRHLNRSVIRKRTNKMLKTTHLISLANRYPNDLSGGQQQRVSLAKGMVLDPQILLMDEPLSNLDARLRAQMSTQIRNLQKDFHITTVYVTHNQRECFAISDRVAIIHDGQIEQMDTPQNIYERPKSKFIAKFIGYDNIMPVSAGDHGKYWIDHTSVQLVTDCDQRLGYFTINPSKIQIKGDDSSTGPNLMKGNIVSRIFLGDNYQYGVKTPLGILKIRENASHVYKVHTSVDLCLPQNSLIPLFK